MEDFQNLITSQITDSMYAWRPTINVSEILEPVFWENNIMLQWDEFEEEIFGNDSPRGYVIYRSEEPFRQNVRGDSLVYVEQMHWTDYNMPAVGSFYRIETRF